VRTWLWVAASRVIALFTSRRLDEDFDAEVRAHIEMLTDEHVRRGMTRDAARRAAILRFGGAVQIKEQRRTDRSLPWVDTTLQDLRYALRSLRRHVAFSTIAVATLAVGIGAGTVVFTFASATLLRPLPYRNPHELVRIFETNPLKDWTRNIAAPANYADWKAQNTVFTDIAAYEQFNSNGSGAGDVFLAGFGEPQGLKSMGVSGNLFRVLGAAPLMGRTFTDDETFEGRARVVVVSYALWQGVLGADPGIVGRTIMLSGRAYNVVGVMPRRFFFPGRDVQLWMPFAYQPSVFAQARRPHWLGAVARRKPGVSLGQAQQEMNAIARRLEQQYPDTNTQMGVRLESFHDSLAYQPRAALLMLSGAVGVLFLIVCVNIANLQLGRGLGRTRELAIRRALGAGRRRLMRQLLTEALVLSLAGGVLGVALAAGARTALLRLAPSAVPLFAEVRFDSSVALFAVVLSLVAPLVFGVVPALTSSRPDRLNERADTGGRRASALRNALVAAEVALSVVLVVGAALLVRSLLRLQTVDPGFNQNQVVSFRIALPTARYADNAQRWRAFDAIERQLRQQPGMQGVGATSTLALRGFTWTGDATVEGRSATDYERELRHKSVTPGYFATMGIRLLAGRMLDERDVREQPPVTLVNEALARRYFRGAPAIGKRITFGRPQDNAPWVTIVGVVADEKQDALEAVVQPEAYTPLAQRMQNPMTYVVRSPLDPEAIVAAARQAVHGVDRDLALSDVTTLERVVQDSLADERFRTTLLSAFAAVALLLAALGIYGVLAYFVSQRSRELGIRLALGAHPASVFRLVIKQGMRPVLIGASGGLLAAIAVTGTMRSLLFGVRPIDPATYAVAIAMLGAIAVTACALPAARAMRVDPLVALREE